MTWSFYGVREDGRHLEPCSTTHSYKVVAPGQASPAEHRRQVWNAKDRAEVAVPARPLRGDVSGVSELYSNTRRVIAPFGYLAGLRSRACRLSTGGHNEPPAEKDRLSG